MGTGSSNPPSRSIATSPTTTIARTVPHGRALFLEHVLGRGLHVLVQRLAAPVWPRLFAGCRPDRDTVAAMRDAGFVVTDLERFQARPAPPVISPAVQGVARLRGADGVSGTLCLVGGNEWSDGCTFDAELLKESASSDVLVLPTAAAYEHPQRGWSTTRRSGSSMGGTVTGLTAPARRTKGLRRTGCLRWKKSNASGLAVGRLRSR